MILCNAKIVPMEGEIIENGYISVENGKISGMGSMKNVPEGEHIDVHGGWILPGLVDAHTHLGLFEDSLGFEGEDGNEDTDPITL